VSEEGCKETPWPGLRAPFVTPPLIRTLILLRLLASPSCIRHWSSAIDEKSKGPICGRRVRKTGQAHVLHVSI